MQTARPQVSSWGLPFVRHCACYRRMLRACGRKQKCLCWFLICSPPVSRGCGLIFRLIGMVKFGNIVLWAKESCKGLRVILDEKQCMFNDNNVLWLQFLPRCCFIIIEQQSTKTILSDVSIRVPVSHLPIVSICARVRCNASKVQNGRRMKFGQLSFARPWSIGDVTHGIT